MGSFLSRRNEKIVGSRCKKLRQNTNPEVCKNPAGFTMFLFSKRNKI
jgi:hypothetical protein